MMNFTAEELALIESNGVTAEEVSKTMEMFPQNLDTAIASVVMLKKGEGQERNEPFQTQAEADAQVSGEVQKSEAQT